MRNSHSHRLLDFEGRLKFIYVFFFFRISLLYWLWSRKSCICSDDARGPLPGVIPHCLTRSVTIFVFVLNNKRSLEHVVFVSFILLMHCFSMRLIELVQALIGLPRPLSYIVYLSCYPLWTLYKELAISLSHDWYDLVYWYLQTLWLSDMQTTNRSE